MKRNPTGSYPAPDNSLTLCAGSVCAVCACVCVEADHIAFQRERNVTERATVFQVVSTALKGYITMSNFKDTNSCPDGYRALNTSELQELLQDEDKMDQIIRLNEKVFFSFSPFHKEAKLTITQSAALIFLPF